LWENFPNIKETGTQH